LFRSENSINSQSQRIERNCSNNKSFVVCWSINDSQLVSLILFSMLNSLFSRTIERKIICFMYLTENELSETQEQVSSGSQKHERLTDGKVRAKQNSCRTIFISSDTVDCLPHELTMPALHEELKVYQRYYLVPVEFKVCCKR
jgi:hypothetical protein